MSMATQGPNGKPIPKVIYAKGRDMSFKQAPSNAELLDMVLALTAELSVLRDRLDTHERLAQLNMMPSLANVEQFQPEEDVTEHRKQTRKRLLSKVFRTLKVKFARSVDEAEAKSNASRVAPAEV